MTTATATQPTAPQGETQVPPTPQKPPHLTERTGEGKAREFESPRADSRDRQTIGRTTRQDTALPTLKAKGSATHLTQPQGSARQARDGDAARTPIPFVTDSWRDPPPHSSRNTAFASLRLRVPTVIPPRQCSASAPALPHAHEPHQLTVDLREMDNDDNGSAMDGYEDPMEELNRTEDILWDESPFTNS